MAEGSELMNRLMSENADLKKQVRLLKENQMLKRLLSESCQESCSRGGRDLLFPKAPTYPEACSPGNGGEVQACSWGTFQPLRSSNLSCGMSQRKPFSQALSPHLNDGADTSVGRYAHWSRLLKAL